MSDVKRFNPAKVKTYKLRAECLHDVYEFIKALYQHSYETSDFTVKPFINEGLRFPDVQLEFVTGVSMKTIKEILGSIPDSHVMLETVEPIEKYTGERK